MPIWDNIYKNYQNNGQSWATIGEGLMPEFINFIKINEFSRKRCFEIGCGTGKYIKYLNSLNFSVDGIDSSEIAVAMTKKIVKKSAEVICADMFNFDMPLNKYDLIYSISTIHHGRKEQIINLINIIYNSLFPSGKIFITLPNKGMVNKWDTFKNCKELFPGTYIPTSGPEKGLLHSFFSAQEIKKIFFKFKELKIESDEIGRWVVTARK